MRGMKFKESFCDSVFLKNGMKKGAVEERAGDVVGFPDAAFFGFCGDWD